MVERKFVSTHRDEIPKAVVTLRYRKNDESQRGYVSTASLQVPGGSPELTSSLSPAPKICHIIWQILLPSIILGNDKCHLRGWPS